MRAVKLLIMTSLLVGLPPIGIALAGKPLARYLEFPPLTHYVEHASFSWTAFVLLTTLVLAIFAPLTVRIVSAPHTPRVHDRGARRFPWWGWFGVGVMALAWVFAWTRFSWFRPLQPFTFTPLWVGYILIMNALTFQRSGGCLMLDRAQYFWTLFPLSAAFWWFFEYLNRFVQNWYYIGGTDFGPLEYFLRATLPFSTVLPAVLSTSEWLTTYPRMSQALRNAWPLRMTHPRVVSWSVLFLAGAGLMGIGIWPDYLFPLLWISPLLIITSLQAIVGEETIFSGIRQGDWRAIGIPALAGLVCGFFWEMWNSRSFAHWEYAVPFVDRWHLFEMPLLGYAGYLPFGLECLVIANFLSGARYGRAFGGPQGG
ncbi:MAG: hypothetical protein ACE5NA_06250 [Nitrospiraceae bacterium]